MKNIFTHLILVTLVVTGLSGRVSAQGGATCATASLATTGSNSTSAFSGSPTNGTDNEFKWFSFTSTGCGTIQVSSCNGGSDTRLEIFSGTCAAPVSLGANDDTPGCISAGTDEYGSDLSVSVAAGTTYYIRWGNGWDAAAFTWDLTFTSSTVNNVGIEDKSTEYTLIQKRQFSGTVPLNVLVSNKAGVNNNNLSVSCNVIDLNAMALINSFTSPNISLSCGTSTTVNLGSQSLPVAAGAYAFTYSFSSDEFATDTSVSDNVDTTYLIISDDTYGRADAYITGNVDGGLGTTGSMATPSENFQGQRYDIICNDRIDSVQFYMNGGTPGDTIQAQIYDMAAGVPSTLVASSTIIIRGASAPGLSTVALTTPLEVMAGQSYVVGVRHRARGANTGMGYNDQIYTPNAAWIKVGTGGWTNPDNLGFKLAYIISPIFPSCLPITNSISSTNPICTTLGTITNTASEISNCVYFNYLWSTGSTTASQQNLVAGTYTVTTTDNFGCSVTNDVTLTEGTNPLSVDGTVTNGASSSINTTVLGGMANSYLWSNGATTANLSGLTPGTYSVTVTGANGCTASNTFAVTGNVGLNAIPDLAQLSIAPNPASVNINISIAFEKPKNIQIQIINGIGQKVYNQYFSQFLNDKVDINVKDLSNGVYQLNVVSGNDRVSRKIVISK